MKIELVEDNELYGVVVEIPEYIESYILFENTTKSFSNVYKNTDSNTSLLFTLMLTHISIS